MMAHDEAAAAVTSRSGESDQFVRLIVFAARKGGGNPCGVIRHATDFSASMMLRIAREQACECVFVSELEQRGAAEYHFRFFSPDGEMAMCGHASIAAAWILAGAAGSQLRFNIATKAGLIIAEAGGGLPTRITQPYASITEAELGPILAGLSISRADLAGSPALSASTMRAKVLVELATVEHLHALAPAGERIKAACETLGTTGLYPWARAADGSLHARQFPYDAGYHEDPATGIAAAGLFYGLGAPAGGIDVFQGEAMGRPSLIHVRSDLGGQRCWIGGDVALTQTLALVCHGDDPAPRPPTF